MKIKENNIETYYIGYRMGNTLILVKLLFWHVGSSTSFTFITSHAMAQTYISLYNVIRYVCRFSRRYRDLRNKTASASHPRL